jgi:phosphatidylglycerol:prolipoprotein diacylglycerol transferase
MFPRLIDFGVKLGQTELFVPTYGLLFASGALLAWYWFVRRGRELGLPEDQLFNLSFYTLLAGILGAKLTLVLVDWDLYVEHPRLLLGTLRSAGVVIGGIIGGSIAFTVYARRNGMPLFRLGDAIAAPLALAQSMGRLGCFSAGCCWGKPAEAGSAFGIVFTNPNAASQTGVPLGVALLPTQMMHMVSNLLLALLLTWLWRRRVEPPGTVFWIYVLLYSLSRGLIEFWRGDTQRGLYFGETVSTSQLFALGGIVLAIGMMVRGARQLARSTD